MKNLKFLCLILLTLLMITLIGCASDSNYTYKEDTNQQIDISNNMQVRQPTPSDIEYSLERYNLIKRAYWVNGQREKANALPCEIERPLGYVVLLTNNGAIISRFIVDGKITSLNSFLSPDSEYFEQGDCGHYSGDCRYANEWLADVDGAYGVNDDGIFFFTPDGKYIEWNGTYLYSDIPFEVEDPVVKIGG